MHKFERKYLGHNMICPNCNQGFKAVEEVTEGDEVRRSARVRVRDNIFGEGSPIAKGRLKNDGKKGVLGVKSANFKGKKKKGSLNEVLGKGKSKRVEMPMDEGRRTEVVSDKLKNKDRTQKLGLGRENENGNRKRGRSEVIEGSEEELTLAEMKLETLKKKLKGKKVKIREESEVKKNKGRRLLPLVEKSGDMEVMAVEDSDFYDFDEDRVERSFKKGQVWAIYDDDDGMPRHYGLIDEVVSVNPFQVKMSWLDLHNHGDDQLLCWEKMGFQFHISCGRFKVARKDTISLLNIFSHLVECERAARELYRVYPRKGSVWALYNEQALDREGGNSSGRDRRNYDIVVLLTSYSEMHGLSMAYLEKVDGFRAVFKRRESGYHAIRWLEKGDVMLFSHQIPSRKLSGNEAPDISGYCWELDPASLPPNLLAITWRK